VGAKNDLLGWRVDDDGVPDVAGRMVCRDIEQVEVVLPGFHFRSEDGLEPQVREDLDQFIDHLVDRVQSADGWCATGHGHVNRFGIELGLDRLEGARKLLAELVRGAAHRWPVFGGKLAESALEQLHRALRSEEIAFPFGGFFGRSQLPEPLQSVSPDIRQAGRGPSVVL
jgi:hypothetical protein